MKYTPNGIVFTDLNDLFVNYLAEMGLGVNRDQYLYDQDTGDVLKYNDKFIKVSINGVPAYPGMNDILFDPIHNYGIVSTLFGRFIDKAQDTDDGDIIQGYIAHSIQDQYEMKGNKKINRQRVVVKSVGRGEISSHNYLNIFLAFIDCTFTISGYNVDLTPFDIDYSAVQ